MKPGLMCLIALLLVVSPFRGAAQVPDLARMDLVEKSIPDGPVAKINGVNISADEFRKLYKNDLAVEMSFRSGEGISPKVRVRIGVRALRTLIDREILCQEAQRLKLTVSQDETDKAWQNELDLLRKQFFKDRKDAVSETELLEALSASRESALEDLRKALLAERAQNYLAEKKGVTVTDEEVKDYFDKHEKDFRQPDRCHMKQMFFQSEKGAENAEEARKKAETALKRIRAGESFEAVARAMSEGQYKDAGGDWGPQPAGALPPFLVDAAAKLEPGAISDAIQSDYGYHIIKLVEFLPGAEVSFEKAGPFIRRRLQVVKSDRVVDDFCTEVINKGDAVQVFLELDRTLAAYPELNVFDREGPSD